MVSTQMLDRTFANKMGETALMGELQTPEDSAQVGDTTPPKPLVHTARTFIIAGALAMGVLPFAGVISLPDNQQDIPLSASAQLLSEELADRGSEVSRSQIVVEGEIDADAAPEIALISYTASLTSLQNGLDTANYTLSLFEKSRDYSVYANNLRTTVTETEELIASIDLTDAETPAINAAQASIISATATLAERQADARSAFHAILEKQGANPGIGPNGQMSSANLCSVDFAPSVIIDCLAVDDLEALNAAFYEEFGHNLPVGGGYRSYGEQVSTKASRGSKAATPGKSNHGWGRAIDLSISGNRSWNYNGVKYQWLRENGPDYFWVNPTWAQSGGSNPENWHWEWAR